MVKYPVYPLYPHMTDFEAMLHARLAELQYWIGIYKFTGKPKDYPDLQPYLAEWHEVSDVLELLLDEQEGMAE